MNKAVVNSILSRYMHKAAAEGDLRIIPAELNKQPVQKPAWQPKRKGDLPDTAPLIDAAVKDGRVNLKDYLRLYYGDTTDNRIAALPEHRQLPLTQRPTIADVVPEKQEPIPNGGYNFPKIIPASKASGIAETRTPAYEEVVQWNKHRQKAYEDVQQGQYEGRNPVIDAGSIAYNVPRPPTLADHIINNIAASVGLLKDMGYSPNYALMEQTPAKRIDTLEHEIGHALHQNAPIRSPYAGKTYNYAMSTNPEFDRAFGQVKRETKKLYDYDMNTHSKTSGFLHNVIQPTEGTDAEFEQRIAPYSVEGQRLFRNLRSYKRPVINTVSPKYNDILNALGKQTGDVM